MTDKPNRDFGAKPLRKLIERGLRDLGMSINEVAAAIGFKDPYLLQTYLDGSTKIPLDRMPALARAFGVDQILAVRCWMAEYIPDLLEIVDGLPQPPLLTANERRLIKRIREFTENTDADIVIADGRDVLALVMV